jgi:hypothetical protein
VLYQNYTVRSQPTAACQLLLNADCLATAFWLAAGFERQTVTVTVVITHRHFLLCATEHVELFAMLGSKYQLERIAYII